MAAFAPKEDDIVKAESAIEQEVELENLGLPTKLLQMELTWRPGYVKLTQQSAIGNLTKEFGIALTIPTRSLQLNQELYVLPLKEDEKPTIETQKKYQSFVGSLLYIARHTRPAITLHVNLLERRTSHATSNNLKGALQVLRYLASSLEDGIVIKSQERRNDQISEQSISIKGYTNSLWQCWRYAL